MQVRGCGENYLRHFLGTAAINLKFGHFFAPKLDQIRSSVDVLYGSSLQKPSARNDRLKIFDNVDHPKRQLPIPVATVVSQPKSVNFGVLKDLPKAHHHS